MFKKTLIAAAAVAAVISVAAPSAKADTTIDFGIGIGTGGYAPDYGYPGYGFGDLGFGFHHRRHHGFYDFPPPRPRGISCGMGRDVVRNAGFRHVSAYDCSAPTYGYQAWRNGDLYKVVVNYRGAIVSVRPIW
jgi:hypothetical protein